MTSRPEASRAGSIIGRLILLSTVTGFTILVLGSLFIIRLAESNLEREWRDIVVAKLLWIDSELRTGTAETEREELEEIEAGIESENRFMSLGGMYLDIRGSRAESKLQTDGMYEILQHDPPFPDPVADISRAELRNWTSPEGRYYVLSAAVVPVEGRERLIRLAFDATSPRLSFIRFRRLAGVATISGTILFALCAMWIARRALRPLDEIVSLSERIGADHLDDRIGSRVWPRELQRLAAAYDAMLDRLETSFDHLSRFSADIAHELRTPVNNIMGEAEVTLLKTRSQDEYHRTLESILEEGRRLTTIIESLLFLSRADSTEGVGQWAEEIDLREEIDEIVRQARQRIGDRRLDLSVHGEGTVVADRSLLRRAVSNVLSNAIQFTPDGGAIHIGIDGSGDRVSISVRDDGVGIAPEHLPRIFERFYQTDESRRSGEGSGLGLSIVQSIMNLHGGTVEIESEPGRGTTVTLSFESPSVDERTLDLLKQAQ